MYIWSLCKYEDSNRSEEYIFNRNTTGMRRATISLVVYINLLCLAILHFVGRQATRVLEIATIVTGRVTLRQIVTTVNAIMQNDTARAKCR